MTIVYRPTTGTSVGNRIQKAGNNNLQTYSGTVDDSSQMIAEFWTREEAALFEQWASSFDRYNGALNNPYFDYFFSGEDINVTIEGLDVMDQLAITSFAYNIQQQKQPVYGFWDYCVDDQTEAFTKRGWIHGNDLREDDTILSMDAGALVWSAVLEIYRNPNYDGLMHRLIGSNSIDALVTDGHRFALTSGELKNIDDLNKTDTLKIMGQAVDDSFTKYSDELIIFQSLITGFKGKRIESEWVFEVSSEIKDDFELYLKRCNVKYYDEYANHNTVFKINQSIDRIEFNTEFLIDISRYQRQLVWEILWSIPHTYLTEEANVALCTLLGIPTKMGKNGMDYSLHQEVKVSDLFMPGYQDSRKGLKNIPTERYKGLVWCPKTQYGTFVCRRNGQTYVTGNTYSAMLRGNRIITGAFSIASTGPIGLNKLISKAAGVRARAKASTEIRDLHSVRGLDIDEANIEKYWRRNLDKNLEPYQQHLFSVHPPFNFLIQYGLQETSLVSNNPEVRAEEFKLTFRERTVMSTDYNERLVKSPSDQDDFKILLENVELISKQVQYDSNGEPITEIYSFMARDERFLSDAVYANITPLSSNGLDIIDGDVQYE